MNSRQILKKNGKAFSWATTFMSKSYAVDIANLYAFCRFLDDHVDIKNESCSSIKADIYKGISSTQETQEIIQLIKQGKIDIDPLIILIDTIDRDRSGFRIQDQKELVRYCYGVASTVGLMMCQIFGIRTPKALPFAIDLGIGMQLTNIARDIVEDARADRVYLPQHFFTTPLTPACLLEKKRMPEVWKAQEYILQLSDSYYQSADKGMSFLPWDVRLSIVIASRLYQAKGFVIRSNPQRFYEHRADVNLCGKCVQTIRAMASFPLLSFSNTSHDSILHKDLISMPYVNL